MRVIPKPDVDTSAWGWDDLGLASAQARLLFEFLALPFEVVEVSPMSHSVRYAIALVGSDEAVCGFIPMSDPPFRPRDEAAREIAARNLNIARALAHANGETLP